MVKGPVQETDDYVISQSLLYNHTHSKKSERHSGKMYPELLLFLFRSEYEGSRDQGAVGWHLAPPPRYPRVIIRWVVWCSALAQSSCGLLGTAAQIPHSPQPTVCTLVSLLHKHCKRASRSIENTGSFPSCQDVKISVMLVPRETRVNYHLSP